jgi:hypothetical protein
MDEEARRILTALGLEVQPPGAGCDATLVLDAMGRAVGLMYTAGYLYTGAIVNGEVSLTAADQPDVSVSFHLSQEPAEYWMGVQGGRLPTEPYDVDFKALWFGPFAEAMASMWGPRT